eukprot:1061345-Lingulodinium_polyedra.AAC.1
MAYPQEWRTVLYLPKRPLSGAVLTYSTGEVLAGGGPVVWHMATTIVASRGAAGATSGSPP